MAKEATLRRFNLSALVHDSQHFVTRDYNQTNFLLKSSGSVEKLRARTTQQL